MNWLPEGTKIPDTSRYMKFKEGPNKFRAMDKAIIGTEYWTEDKEGNRKPVRVKVGVPVPMEKVSINKFGKKQINFFMAFPVYNYSSENIQILEIIQKSVQEGIMGLYNNPEWGDPVNYDIIVTQTKEGGRIKYPSIQANPKKEVSKAIKDLWTNTYVDVNKLFDSGDPFEESEVVKPEEVPL